MFKNIILLREMQEKLEHLKLLESWHWSVSAKHAVSHKKITKARRALESKIADAEHKFVIEATKD